MLNFISHFKRYLTVIFLGSRLNSACSGRIALAHPQKI